jgi:hypothetical protein
LCLRCVVVFKQSFMDVLGTYGSDDEESTTAPAFQPRPEILNNSICSAPLVVMSSNKAPSKLLKPDQGVLLTNPTADIVLAQSEGPAHPFRFNVAAPGAKQVGMGQIEDAAIEDWTFNDQYQTYQRSGFAIDASSNAILGDYGAYLATNGDTAQTARGKFYSLTSVILHSHHIGVKKVSKEKRKREALYEDLGDSLSGPWAPAPVASLELPSVPVQMNAASLAPNPVPKTEEAPPAAAPSPATQRTPSSNLHIVEPDEEAEMWERVNERKISYTMPPRPTRGSFIGEVQYITQYNTVHYNTSHPLRLR